MTIRKTELITAVLIAAVLALSGCASSESSEKPTRKSEESAVMTEADIESETAETETVQIKNKKPVKLYYMDYALGEAQLIKSYSCKWDPDEDIGVFGAFNSSQDTIPFTSETEAHQTLWDQEETDESYRIGYEISFMLDGKKRTVTILSPSDIEDSPYLFMGDADSGDVTGYMGVWVYDDYHQDGGFYSHVSADEFDDNTLLTSIKLRPTPKSSGISGLELMTFSYSSDLEFDSDMHYNGQAGYSVDILNE